MTASEKDECSTLKLIKIDQNLKIDQNFVDEFITGFVASVVVHVAV